MASIADYQYQSQSRSQIDLEKATEAYYSYRRSEIGEYIREKKRSITIIDTGYKFSNVDHLKSIWKKPIERAPIRHLTTPDTLVILCTLVLHRMPMPEAYWWERTDILEWIEGLGFPEYKLTFYENFITGQNLVFLEAKDLQAMNIKSFENIVKITKAIRNLFGIEMIRFVRSISLPIRLPLTHYVQYRGLRGTKYYNTEPYALWHKMKILPDKPLYEEHWDLLHKHLTNRRWIYEQPILFGYTADYNLYRVKKLPKLDANTKKTWIKKDRCNCTFLPCICDKHYYKPLRSKPYKHLHWINKIMEQKTKSAFNDETADCQCDAFCTCNLSYYNTAQTINFLRKKIPIKYETAQLQKTLPSQKGQKDNKSRLSKASNKSRRSLLTQSRNSSLITANIILVGPVGPTLKPT